MQEAGATIAAHAGPTGGRGRAIATRAWAVQNMKTDLCVKSAGSHFPASIPASFTNNIRRLHQRMRPRIRTNNATANRRPTTPWALEVDSWDLPMRASPVAAALPYPQSLSHHRRHKRPPRLSCFTAHVSLHFHHHRRCRVDATCDNTLERMWLPDASPSACNKHDEYLAGIAP